jgi:hypothetical protein
MTYGYREQARQLHGVLSAAKHRPDGVEEIPRELTLHMLGTVSTLDRSMRKKLVTDHIIESLKYRNMSTREEMIPKAFRATFDWIFHKPMEHDSCANWADFGRWLQEDEQIYWIAGKPGAGKSTLVKYLFHHPRTDELIKGWPAASRTGPSSIHKAGFFFWNSGSLLQMSRVGFARSILSQLWHDSLDVAELFPSRWKRCEILGEDKEPFNWEELMFALNIVLSTPGRYFLLFVDGLDEFEGNKHLLADYILSLASNANVKICTASRPWVEFQSKFHGRPSLMMENLTRKDMISYIDGRFTTSREFEIMMKHEPGRAADLKDSIIAKASGVFLWVYVVVSTLLEGLVDGDRPEQLTEKLDALPPELDELFEKIILQLEPKHASEASELFQFVRKNADDATLIGLYWSRLDLAEVLQCPVTEMSESHAAYLSQLMQRNVVSRCKCLLDAGASSNAHPGTVVTWTHRTVREYLEQRHVWSRIRDYSPSYDPVKAFCLSKFRQAKASMTSLGSNDIYAKDALYHVFTKALVFDTLFDKSRFVQEIERVGTIIQTRSGRPLVKNRNYVYWLDADGITDENGEIQGVHGYTTTFHAAMALGYDWVVRDQVQLDPGILDIPASSDVNIDALMLASTNGWFEMMHICLQGGSRPTKTSHPDQPHFRMLLIEETAWQMFLNWIFDGRQLTDGGIWSQVIHCCAEFLRCGADPNETAQGVLEYILKHVKDGDDAEDVRIIKKCTRKRKRDECANKRRRHRIL